MSNVINSTTFAVVTAASLGLGAAAVPAQAADGWSNRIEQAESQKQAREARQSAARKSGQSSSAGASDAPEREVIQYSPYTWRGVQAQRRTELYPSGAEGGAN